MRSGLILKILRAVEKYPELKNILQNNLADYISSNNIETKMTSQHKEILE